MVTAPVVVSLLLTTLPAPARASEDLSRAAASTEEDLQASLKELTALREQIAAEKLPLAAELGALEERLRSLRTEHESALRGIDTGTLDMAATQGELKLRQEETGYVANLLDEYVRGFETRLNVAEAPRYTEAVAAAKDAAADPALTPPEKFARQLAVVSASLTRMDDLVGGTRFKGTAVGPEGVVAEGQFALIGPIALFAAGDGSTAGLALPQTGSSQPAVRPLDEALNLSVAAVVNGGTGLLPVDPTRGAALKELVERWSLIDLFKKGGPIMWPLLAVSILVFGTVLERVAFVLMERKKRDSQALQELLAAVEQGEIERAIRAGSASKFLVVRALVYALQHREKSLPSALLFAQAQELKRFSRGLPILDTAITISPLLGLLGTVTGMMRSFSLIGGELSAPAAITGGIAEALIATAFGLGIAILALIPFNYLNNHIEEARHELEAAATQLELLFHPVPGAVMPADRRGAARGRAARHEEPPAREDDPDRQASPPVFTPALRTAQE